jgi:hypothetical protein
VDAASAWNRIEESELEVAGVTTGTGFGRSAGLRIRGKIFAIYNDGELILKLPRDRVGELTASGKGRPWGPGTGRIMKEWVAVSAAASGHWQALAAEARTFVGSGQARAESTES